METWKKTFAIIWSGQLASILSSEVVAYSIIFWMSLETGSAEVLAIAAIASILPQSLLGLFVGVYVDRWDRKRTMILADSFIALCTLALAILFRAGVAEMWHIYILLACRSAGSAFHMPAMQASVPLLAPQSQLTRIAGINQIIASLSSIAGPGPRSAAHQPHFDRQHPAAGCRGSRHCLHLAALRPHPQPGARHDPQTRPVARIPGRLLGHARHSGYGLVLHAVHRRLVLHHARRCDVPADDAPALRGRHV